MATLKIKVSCVTSSQQSPFPLSAWLHWIHVCHEKFLRIIHWFSVCCSYFLQWNIILSIPVTQLLNQIHFILKYVTEGFYNFIKRAKRLVIVRQNQFDKFPLEIKHLCCLSFEASFGKFLFLIFCFQVFFLLFTPFFDNLWFLSYVNYCNFSFFSLVITIPPLSLVEL